MCSHPERALASPHSTQAPTYKHAHTHSPVASPQSSTSCMVNSRKLYHEGDLPLICAQCTLVSAKIARSWEEPEEVQPQSKALRPLLSLPPLGDVKSAIAIILNVATSVLFCSWLPWITSRSGFRSKMAIILYQGQGDAYATTGICKAWAWDSVGS